MFLAHFEYRLEQWADQLLSSQLKYGDISLISLNIMQVHLKLFLIPFLISLSKRY